MLSLGQRVVYVGPLPAQRGHAGVIDSMFQSGFKFKALMKFDVDGRGRVVDCENLVPEGEYKVARQNFKTLVKAALDALLKPLDADSAKERAVRKLGVAAELCRVGDAEKKKAKCELVNLGVIQGPYEPGSKVIFDSPNYVVTAETKQPSSRLDAGRLTAAMRNEKLSEAMQRRILAAATVDNAAATSFKVEAK